MATSATTVTTGEARLSYTNLFQPFSNNPNSEPKYSVTVLVPKSDAQTKLAIDRAIQVAIESGVNKNWNGVRPPMIAICVHDGDGPRPSDGQPFGEECRGHWVFTASSKKPPFVVDQNVQGIINQAEVYSGMYGRVSVNFFAYNSNGKKGIGCGLNGVQKSRDGEALGGRVSAEEAFGAPAGVATPSYGAAMPATPGAYGATPTPVYQQPAYPMPGYPVQAPAQASPYGVDPITGQPIIQPAAPYLGM